MDDIVDALTKKGDDEALVGIQSGEDQELLKYASAQEFGARIERTGKNGEYEIVLPSRPFLRQTYDKYFDEIVKEGKRMAAAVTDGRLTKSQALFAWGEFYKSLINKEINDGNNFEPNKPKTLKRKGGNKFPLQDSGRLQGAIKTVVE